MEEIQTRDARPRGTSRPAEAERGERYALVIGVDSYQGPLRRLKNAVNDAQAISDVLSEEFGFQVVSLQDEQANKEVILETMSRSMGNTASNDSVLFFFAGHGENIPGEEEPSKGFILPVDSTEEPETWIPESQVIQAARESPASYVFLIFDACYAGTAFRDDIPSEGRDDQILKALVAGTEDQPVLDGGAGEHSIFTRSILDGLDGFADSGQQPDDVITAGELITYVRSEVQWRSQVRGHPQSAKGGSLQGSRSGEDFQFVPINARLKAPILRNLHSPEYQDRLAAAEQLGMPAQESVEVIALKVEKLNELLAHDESSQVRVMAARSLGKLKDPDGIGALHQALKSSAALQVRREAGISLGKLVRLILDARMPDCEAVVERAIGSLIGVMGSEEAALRQAAKEGLSHLPESAERIKTLLRMGDRELRREALDALAYIADRNPDVEIAWPVLDRVGHRVRRRLYLTRLRMDRLWPGILRPVLGVAMGGAIGLSLGYFIVVLVAFESALKLFGPAVLTFNLWPGAFSGAGLALMPRLVRRVYRKPRRLTRRVAAILGGLFLTLGMVLPNWFLGVGDDLLAWLLPGLLIGPSIGLALSILPLEVRLDDRGERRARLQGLFRRIRPFALQILAIALVGFLTFTVSHLPARTSLNALDDPLMEALFWGFGGAILAGSLGISWLLWPMSGLGTLLQFDEGEIES